MKLITRISAITDNINRQKTAFFKYFMISPLWSLFIYPNGQMFTQNSTSLTPYWYHSIIGISCVDTLRENGTNERLIPKGLLISRQKPFRFKGSCYSSEKQLHSYKGTPSQRINSVYYTTALVGGSFFALISHFLEGFSEFCSNFVNIYIKKKGVMPFFLFLFGFLLLLL